MKLSKSKLTLAKVINENGGWPQDSEWAVQNGDHGRISFSINKPVRHDSKSWMAKGGFNFKIEVCKPLKNWHQCVLNREEYYQAYPMTDDDGWVEWKGGKFPALDESGSARRRDGVELSFGPRNAYNWRHDESCPRNRQIVAYRLHKQEVKHEFCESVMRSIPEPEAKPTIERLAQDYRNKLYFANRKQQEADDAMVAADVALGKLERAGEEIGLLIGIHKDGSVVDYLGWNSWITGDLVELVNRQGGMAKVGEIGPISKVVGGGDFYVDFPSQSGYLVEHSDVKFIRRP